MTTKTTTTYGDYIVETFSGAGSISWDTPTGVTSCDVLVVGGGASGEGYPSAVYGADGVVYEGTVSPTGSYTVTVGTGGYVYGLHYHVDGGSSSIGALATASGGTYITSTPQYGLTRSQWGVSISGVGKGGYWVEAPGTSGWYAGSSGIVMIKYAPAVVISTEGADTITSTGFTLNGNISYGTATVRGFCYVLGTGTPTTSDTEVHEDGTFTTGTYDEVITGLAVGTTYSVRAYVINDGTTYYGDTTTVTTLKLTADLLDNDGVDLLDWTNGDTSPSVSGSESNFETTALWTDTQGSGRGYFSSAPDGKVIYCNGVDSLIWGGKEMKPAAVITSTAAVGDDGVFTGAKDVTDRMQNFKTTTEETATVSDTIMIGSPVKLSAVKFYVSTGNTSASAMTGKTWVSDSWDSLTLVDNTDTGASLAVTGWVTFDSLSATPRYLEGYYLYWYQFHVDAGSAVIYQINVDAPFQSIVDIWDGVYRDISACYKRTTAVADNSLNVYRDDYDKDIPDTYMDLSSMSAYSSPANTVEVGFTEKMTGLQFRLPPDYVNTTAATSVSIDYWDGSAYATVGTVADGTSAGSISLAKSGTMTWNNANLTDETKTNMLESAVIGDVANTAVPLYFYRVRFDHAMDSTVRVNYIGGISAPKTMSYYKFPMFAQGRVLLCGDMAGDKNKINVSAKYMPQVYNGSDSVDLYAGDDGELSCGIEIFSQYGSNLYSLILMFKNNETWVIAGQDINLWGQNTYCLSTSIGCPAPQTLAMVNLSAEPGQGINRTLAIWQGSAGIYMSDGRAPIPIHNDIKEYFDMNDSRCINAEELGNSTGFMDYSKQEWHWLFLSGADKTPKEMVYDVKRNKWYEISRGEDANLQCGLSIEDTEGNQYIYGFIDSGYIERLEYGTDFDGNEITSTFQTGDFAPLGLSYVSQLDRLKLMTVIPSSQVLSEITCTAYTDTSIAGEGYSMIPSKNGSYRIATPSFDGKLQGDPYHSLKFTTTTTTETCGFKPLAVVATYHPLTED